MKIENDMVTELKVKVFADDIADAVRAESDQLIDKAGIYEEGDLDLLENYFRNHLYLKNGKKSKYLDLISYSIEDQAVWLEFRHKDPIDEGDVLVGDYLIEIFPNQRNMVRLNRDQNQQFVQITSHRKEISLSK